MNQSKHPGGKHIKKTIVFGQLIWLKNEFYIQIPHEAQTNEYEIKSFLMQS